MSERPHLSNQNEFPVLNGMMEDYLAHSTGTAHDHTLMLRVWVQIGVEYMARVAGRRRTIALLEGLTEFVRTAQPVKPWRD